MSWLNHRLERDVRRLKQRLQQMKAEHGASSADPDYLKVKNALASASAKLALSQRPAGSHLPIPSEPTGPSPDLPRPSSW